MNNRSAVLTLLNARGPMSRKDIADELGLTPASVTQICNDMFAAGILTELGEMKEEKRAGRRKILVGINYKVRYALAIAIEGNEATITISDLKGEVLASHRLPPLDESDPKAFVRLLSVECKLLMWENSIPRESMLGVGVSVPGNVNRALGICQHPNQTINRTIPFAAMLEAELGMKVIVENNVKAYAEAGAVYGVAGEPENQNTLFIKWGPGVGAALVIHGAIYEGQRAKAAELGHIRLLGNHRPCRCGRVGCLETIASTHALADSVREACSPQSTPVLWELVQGDVSQIMAHNMEWWAQAEDEGMWAVLDETIRQMAHVVCGITTMLAPDGVSLYGRVFGLPRFMSHFTDYCKQYDAAYDEALIFQSKLSDKIDYIGPLAAVVDELFLSGRSLDGTEQ